jgi:hypothetical protein
MKQLAEDAEDRGEARDLMQRMKDRQQGQEQADAGALDGPRQALDEQDSEQAQQSEREARRTSELEKKLDEEETRYQNLRWRRSSSASEKLADARSARWRCDGIAQVDADRAGAEALPRRLRQGQQFADDAAALKKDGDDIRDRVARRARRASRGSKNSGDLDEIGTR